MFQTCPVKIITTEASSSPRFECGKSATKPSTSPGRKPRTGMPWRMSMRGIITRSARRLCAATVPYTRVTTREMT